MARYVFPDPVRELKIEVDLVADMTVYNPFDFFVEDSAEEWPFDSSDIAPDLVIYRTPEPAGPRLAAFLDTIPSEPTGTVDFVVGLNARLANEIGYVIRMEPGVQTPEETFNTGKGPAATPAGCWFRSLRISASPRASSPAI
jgi:transglutaminase-like putative cysteine protease